MTPEERTEKLLLKWRDETVIDPAARLENIRDEIIAAVEEDRKTRQCCADEREACAQIADSEAEGLGDMAQWPDAARYLASRAEIAQGIAEAIRARGNKPEERNQ